MDTRKPIFIGSVALLAALMGLVALTGPAGSLPLTFSAATATPAGTEEAGLPQNINQTTSGLMTEAELWQGDILLTGDVVIPADVTLIIEPGTTIRCTAQSDDTHAPDEYVPEDETTLPATMISILVVGTLEAQGTPDQPIVFTSDSDEPGPIDWQSIMIEGTGAVYLDHVIIEHSYFGIQLQSPEAHVSVVHSTFRDITTCGICTGGTPIIGPIIIADNHFIACGREAVDTYGEQNITVRHNVFSDNYVAIMAVIGSSVTIEDNLFINNDRGIGVVEDSTPTIMGNAFVENRGPAIFVTNAVPTITGNNFDANFLNLQLEGSQQGVVAEDNWWGSIDPTTIAALIHDGSDDPALGVVDFEPYAMVAFDLDVPKYE